MKRQARFLSAAIAAVMTLSAGSIAAGAQTANCVYNLSDLSNCISGNVNTVAVKGNTSCVNGAQSDLQSIISNLNSGNCNYQDVLSCLNSGNCNYQDVLSCFNNGSFANCDNASYQAILNYLGIGNSSNCVDGCDLGTYVPEEPDEAVKPTTPVQQPSEPSMTPQPTEPSVTPQPSETVKPQPSEPETAPQPNVQNDFNIAYADEVIRLVNAERAKYGLAALSKNDGATSAAQTRAKEIVSTFSHTRPDGRSCFTAAQDIGLSYRYAGENIAYGYGSPQAVVTGWMNSEGHRKNILSSSFTQIGVGCYKSGNTLYWTQFFIG